MRSKWMSEILGPSKMDGQMGTVVGQFVASIGAKIDNMSDVIDKAKQREAHRQAKRKLAKVLKGIQE